MPNDVGATRMSPHQNSGGIQELHILWLTGRLSCDGDSVSITAATQPSIEDVARRAKRFGCRIDRCYALVGTLRQHWHGVTGGEAARVALEDFFGDLRHA